MFKVPEALARQLDEQGADRKLSRHELARELLERVLSQSEDQLPTLVAQLSDQAQTLSKVLTSLDVTRASWGGDRLERIEAAAGTTNELTGQLCRQIGELRSDVATAVCGILVQLGKEPADAERWARKTLHLPE
jgi:ABC-type transporter Mla subunit MlaD